MAKKKTPAFSTKMLDQLLDRQDSAMVLRFDDLISELKKALAEAGWLVLDADG